MLTHAPTWMNLENTAKSEASHKRSHIVWFYLYKMFRISKSIETK